MFTKGIFPSDSELLALFILSERMMSPSEIMNFSEEQLSHNSVYMMLDRLVERGYAAVDHIERKPNSVKPRPVYKVTGQAEFVLVAAQGMGWTTELLIQHLKKKGKRGRKVK